MIKLDIISGFLGAGKTTLIQKLFAESFAKEKIVLIENEFGEIGVDGSFLKDSGVNVREINSGCICCSLVGDFNKSLREIIDTYNPDRIIIEPSGVGKLSDIKKAVCNFAGEVQLNICTTVVDGAKAKLYSRNFGEFFIDQVKEASTIVVSKTDTIKESKLNETLEILRGINPSCNIITTSLKDLDGQKLLHTLESQASLLEDLLNELKEEHHHDHDHDDDDEECSCGHHHHDHDEECSCGHHHDHDHDEECSCGHHHHHHHGHDADEVFTSWGTETAKALSYSELDNFLMSLVDSTLGDVLRAKGILKASDKNEWYYFDYVAGDYEIRTGAPDYTGRICVIGSHIDTDKIKELFNK